MKVFRLLALLSLLPCLSLAAERLMKVDKSKTFVDVDVDATLNFTAHLDAYDARVIVDDATGKIKNAVFSFKFTDLKTGNAERDAHMIAWLGGGVPEGRFELGNLAVTPNGQGQASGRLIFHNTTERIEFPVEVAKTDSTYVVTGQVTIDYRNWGLKKIRKAMVFSVDPEVRIRFKLTGEPGDPVAPAAPAK